MIDSRPYKLVVAKSIFEMGGLENSNFFGKAAALRAAVRAIENCGYKYQTKDVGDGVILVNEYGATLIEIKPA